MKKKNTAARADRRSKRNLVLNPKKTWEPYSSILVEMVVGLEGTAEWREATARDTFQQFNNNPDGIRALRAIVANRIVRKLRNADVTKLIESGDPFWLNLATRVVSSTERWHQSGRIKASALRSLARRIAIPGLSTEEANHLHPVITGALIATIDIGAGEEFRDLAKVARRVATNELVTALEDRAESAEKQSVRINARRMLDYVKGKPYRRYLADLK